MGADFYEDDYGYGGGGDYGYYDGGGDWGFDTTSWPTFEEYYGGGGLPPDYGPIPDQAWMIDPSSGFMDLGGGYFYDPSTWGVLDTGLWQGGDTGQGFDWQTEYQNWIAFGVDQNTAASLADQALEEARAAAGAINISQSATELNASPILPDLGQYFPLPYVPDYDYWQSPPYIPIFSDLPVPAPPLPSSPAMTQTTPLPPACPGGQYHPYPIGHPQQNICVPFPTAQAPGTQRQSSGQQSGGGSSAPRPPQQPQQQQCPSGYYRAANGQCLPIPRCTTPGTIFDGARGLCVPQGQALSPLPGEAQDLLSNLKALPWWVWLALGGLFLLSRDDNGRTTTVRYRRAS
jgi:hypothetical protein